MAGIRSARTDEAAAVLDLWRRAGVDPSSTDSVEAVERVLAHNPESLLVAEENGRLVGAVIAAWDGWRGGFYRLAVVPERRRRGIARALVEEGERRLRARGAARAHLIVLDHRDGAAAFWRSLGYDRHPAAGRYRKPLI